jgi:C1A family cysteine protease
MEEKMASTHRFGWKRGLPRMITHRYFPMRGATTIPTAVDLQPKCPPVYDQGDLGSCTAHAGSGLAEFLMMKLGYAPWTPARLALYYMTRVLVEQEPANEDTGCTLADTMTALDTLGVAHESLWWYNTAKFGVRPSKGVFTDASKHVLSKGASVGQDLLSVRSCLAEGYPIIFGFTVYESFETNIGSNGIMPMPKPGEQVLGGHAVMAVGYNDSTRYVKVRNSWGSGWGAQGYFWMPYDFITSNQYADDFWTSHGFATWA